MDDVQVVNSDDVTKTTELHSNGLGGGEPTLDERKASADAAIAEMRKLYERQAAEILEKFGITPDKTGPPIGKKRKLDQDDVPSSGSNSKSSLEEDTTNDLLKELSTDDSKTPLEETDDLSGQRLSLEEEVTGTEE